MKGKRTIVERHQQRAKDGRLSDVALDRAVQAAFHSYAVGTGSSRFGFPR